MDQISSWKQQLSQGIWDERLAALYGAEAVPQAQERILRLLEGWQSHFGRSDCAGVYSAPGRTELGGNHTDHQRGRVLAASVNVDMLAAAAPNHTHLVRILSEGYAPETVDLTQLEPTPQENNTSVALVRGIAANIIEMGYPLSGFDAYITSNVPAGSGLSSSAAYEVLICTIFNQLFCDEALSPIQVAQISQYAENVYFGKPCGLMDQMACSVGGAVAIDFADPLHPAVEQIAVDLEAEGYALCIIDSGADHADLTDEYAAIPNEMNQVAAFFGCQVLQQVAEPAFYASIPKLRAACGDRAVLRAMHFFQETQRAEQEADALRAQDFPRFLTLVEESGRSSATLLQNTFVPSTPQHQAVSLALALTAHALGGEGVVRVHGGGFAGTIQAYVPRRQLSAFCRELEAKLGQGCCHVMSIRPLGGCTILSQIGSEEYHVLH